MTTVLADAYFHTLDPFAIQFTETFGLRWYGLAYAAGFVVAWLILRRLAKTGRTPMTVHATADLMFYLIVGVLLGGRLGYAIFYDQKLFIGFSDSLPYWDLLAINKGGMASHGGIIGVILAAWVFSRRYTLPLVPVLDATSLICAPGLFFGRLANFVNGELHGRAVPDQANPPAWSMKFPQEMQEWSIARLESLAPIVEHVGITSAEWTNRLFALQAATGENYAAARAPVDQVLGALVGATQRRNPAVIDALDPLLTAFYPSQLIQALTDGPLLLGVLLLIWLKPRKPGVVGCWFLMTYGALRIASEVVREPDTGVALLLGLTRGQLLSTLMILSGAVFLYIMTHRDVEKLGGLRRPALPRTDDAQETG